MVENECPSYECHVTQIQRSIGYTEFILIRLSRKILAYRNQQVLSIFFKVPCSMKQRFVPDEFELMQLAIVI